MAWTPNVKKAVDLPVWDWMAQFPDGVSFPGSGNAYDGARYIYWAIQYGSSAAASTTRLYRYDTWTDGWLFMTALTNSFNGVDLEYDSIRNVLYITTAGTALQVFNLTTAAVTVFNQAIPAWSLATITVVLPATLGTGSSLGMPDDTVTNFPQLDTCVVAASPAPSSTVFSETITASSPAGSLTYGHVGCQVRFTSGTLSGQKRLITAVTGTQVTTAAFTAAPVAGDTFVIELPGDTAIAGSTSTTLVVPTTSPLITNYYAFSDVMITAGTGSGQRRRIASNTTTTLTLAAAVTGNPRTGPWTTTPDATSVYRIVPSTDFLYYMPANAVTTFYRIDVVATTGTAWVSLTAITAAPGTGANLMVPRSMDPFGLFIVRGAATSTIYRYIIGTNSYTTLTSYFLDTISAGASTILMSDRRKMWVSLPATQRTAIFDVVTGYWDGAPMEPYAVPLAYDGHRCRYIKTVDGVEYMYQLRAGGQEFWRVPLEWLV